LEKQSKRTDDGYCRIKNNQEINDILEGLNIIAFIKRQTLSWLRHVEHMPEDNIAQKIKRCPNVQSEDLKCDGKMMFWKM
jgi:hypothetical protein